MAIRSGTLNQALSNPPLMDLPYQCFIWRPSSSKGTGVSPQITFTKLNAPVKCDIIAQRDDIFFLQPSEQNLPEVVMHFIYGTDIRSRDKVDFTQEGTFVGDKGSYFEIIKTFRPNDILAYVRCWARQTNVPNT